MGQKTTPRQRELFCVFLLALFPAGNALNPRLDEDTWWHLAVGKYVVEHHAVPTEDPFSRIGQSEHVPWVAYSWLHEVALYEAYQLGGLRGILVFRHILDSLTFLTLAWFTLRGSNGRIKPIIALSLVTLALVPITLERPWHYTIVLTTLTLHATIEARGGAPARRYWWLVPVYALWANLHIQFVLGFGVLGLGLLATMIECWRARERRQWLQWIALILACVAATLVNPYHFRIYQVIYEYTTQTKAMRLVTELAPPDFIYWWNWALLLLLVWAAAKCAVRRLPIFDTALLIVGAVFALRMQRDIWFGALCAAAVLTRLSQKELSLPDRLLALRLAGVIVAAVMVVRVIWGLTLGSGHNAVDENRKEYPAGAVEYLRDHRPPGPLVNHFNWGGYLIWTLPEYPVGMDGRTNLYGEERLEWAFHTWIGDEGWDRDPDLLAAGVILAPQTKKLNAPLTDRLREASDRWRIVYEDDVAVVFVPSGR
jgi:hypothetical protein